MPKAVKMQGEEWRKKVCVGNAEDGSKIYETVYGSSQEEVDEKAKVLAKKRQAQRHNKWNNENKDRVSVVLPKGTKDQIMSLGVTVNQFVKEAVLEKLSSFNN